jgi:hypothetical protein
MSCQGHKIERHLLTFTGIIAANFIKLTPKPSLKIGTANYIYWNSLGPNYYFLFLGIKLFYFSR